MLVKKCIAVSAIIAITLISCSPDPVPPGPTPTPTPVLLDTFTDGWTRQFLPEDINNDVFFSSPATGYIAGNNIYRSTDSGSTWQKVYTNGTVFNIAMTNDNKAFFAGYSTHLLKTINGGSSFVQTLLGNFPSDLFFTDNNNGYSTTNNGLYTTTNGGVSWSQMITSGLPTFPPSEYSTLFFLNNTTGWIAASEIYRSNGSLSNWQLASTTGGTDSAKFISVHAPSATVVYAVNSRSELFKSTNGGVSFSFIKKFADALSLSDVHFINEVTGYVSCRGIIYKTSNGGISWTKVVIIQRLGLVEIHFTNTGHGWAVGDSGIVLKYNP